MPQEIDSSTIQTTAGGNFTSKFSSTDTSTWPDGSCPAITLPPLNLPVLTPTFTTVQPDCKYQFNLIPPIPPVFVPRPQINIPCPLGYTFKSDLIFKASGCATINGNLNIDIDPTSGDSCSYVLKGGVNIDVPCPPCPNGITFTGTPSLTVSGPGLSTTGPDGRPGPIQFSLTGGPCNFTLTGGGGIVNSGGGSASFQSGTCLDCASGNCTNIATNLAAAYTSTTPQVGDTISLCHYTYQVVSATSSTCPDSIRVVNFVVSGTTYYAQLINTDCPNPVTPFWVFVGSGTNVGKISVYWNSYLSSTASGGSNISITNLSTSSTPTWLTAANGDNVYLQLTIASFAVTVAEIICDSSFDPTLDPWTGDGSYLVQDPSSFEQIQAKVWIAKISTDGSGNLASSQRLFNNLVMQNVCVNGYPAVYPTAASS